MQKINITEKNEGQRLDKFLRDAYGLPFGKVQQLCRKGHIRINGGRVKGDFRLVNGAELKIPNLEVVPDSQKTTGKTEYIPTKAELKATKAMIIGEDDHMIWLNKPTGIPVQAGTGHTKSLDRLMAALYPNQPPKLIHRLDKATSGLLLLAKTPEAARTLSEAFKTHKMQKTYIALLSGRMPTNEGSIDAALAKAGQKGHEKVNIDKYGKKAITDFKILQSFGKSLHMVEMQPKTGRMHQLRVHAAQMLKAPIVGDWKYGGEESKITGEGIKKGQMYLHAASLSFIHPHTNEAVTLEAPIPPHFETFKSLMAD